MKKEKAELAEIKTLRELGRRTIQELEIDEGIMASGKNELFGCIFGRDSAIICLKLLRAYKKTGDNDLLKIVAKSLRNLAYLQGKVINIENGEEPGKIIHEARDKGHEHLTKREHEPWYIRKDNTMRNYDSVDSTPLFLIAVFRYFECSLDHKFLDEMMIYVHRALRWLDVYGDSNRDGFVDYRFHPDRKHGGLRIQSWMDSSESLFHEDGKDQPVPYPIASVEVQAYTYLAMRLWSEHFGAPLKKAAQKLKEGFNKSFVYADPHSPKDYCIAAALDGTSKAVLSVRSSPGHILWAAFFGENGEKECILDAKYIPSLVKRLLAPDMFEPNAGIRTLSKHSRGFNAQSYHNGSLWPHDNAMIIEGLENFGYVREAKKVRQAFINALNHFKTPVELFVHDGETGLQPYVRACQDQGWCAASILAEV